MFHEKARDTFLNFDNEYCVICDNLDVALNHKSDPFAFCPSPCWNPSQFYPQEDYSKRDNKERAISYSNGDIPLTFNGSPNSVFPAIHTSVLFLF